VARFGERGVLRHHLANRCARPLTPSRRSGMMRALAWGKGRFPCVVIRPGFPYAGSRCRFNCSRRASISESGS